MKLSVIGAAILAAGVSAAPTATTTSATSATTTSYISQFSPSFSNVPVATGVVTAYNYGPYDTATTLPTTTLTGYPTPWASPTFNEEVEAVYNLIDWSLVPNATVRKTNAATGDFEPATDGPSDPYCWWSDTNCVNPKIDIPQDIYYCPREGDWGLSYDDGPFNRYTGADAAAENPYAEPQLYNFLAANNNQKANLFYIGSNVATYPAAAQRGFNDGHYICVHTWSHPAMTTVTNQQAVAEFYWTLKAIKEVTGVTPKCWRPPQGDVDDRIRSIAWQMGMHTVLWDEDSNDWDMPAPGGGNLPWDTVNGYFEGWVAAEKAGNQTHGHIVLEHELNNATVKMAEKWLPTLQQTFNVIPALACNNISQPYWEQQFVYPLSHQPVNNVTSNATTSSVSALSSATPSTTSVSGA